MPLCGLPKQWLALAQHRPVEAPHLVVLVHTFGASCRRRCQSGPPPPCGEGTGVGVLSVHKEYPPPSSATAQQALSLASLPPPQGGRWCRLMALALGLVSRTLPAVRSRDHQVAFNLAGESSYRTTSPSRKH